jgi:hypothetical protein
VLCAGERRSFVWEEDIISQPIPLRLEDVQLLLPLMWTLCGRPLIKACYCMHYCHYIREIPCPWCAAGAFTRGITSRRYSRSGQGPELGNNARRPHSEVVSLASS